MCILKEILVDFTNICATLNSYNGKVLKNPIQVLWALANQGPPLASILLDEGLRDIMMVTIDDGVELDLLTLYSKVSVISRHELSAVLPVLVTVDIDIFYATTGSEDAQANAMELLTASPFLMTLMLFELLNKRQLLKIGAVPVLRVYDEDT